MKEALHHHQVLYPHHQMPLSPSPPLLGITITTIYAIGYQLIVVAVVIFITTRHQNYCHHHQHQCNHYYFHTRHFTAITTITIATALHQSHLYYHPNINTAVKQTPLLWRSIYSLYHYELQVAMAGT